MSALSLYFLVMLDSIISFFGIVCATSWLLTLILVIVFTVLEIPKLVKRTVIIGISISLFATLIYNMIPSTKQVAFIYIVSGLSQNKIVQDIGEKSLQIPDKALEILNMKMNEYIDDMKKEAVDKAKEAVK